MGGKQVEVLIELTIWNHNPIPCIPSRRGIYFQVIRTIYQAPEIRELTGTSEL